MASITTKLDTRKANKEGHYPVKFVVSNNQTNAYISLNINLPKGAWIKNGNDRPVKSTHPGAKIILLLYEDKKNRKLICLSMQIHFVNLHSNTFPSV